jgi:hypothetical protein
MRLLHYFHSNWMTLMLPVHPWSALRSNPDSNGATCAPDRRYAFAVEIPGGMAGLRSLTPRKPIGQNQRDLHMLLE